MAVFALFDPYWFNYFEFDLETHLPQKSVLTMTKVHGARFNNATVALLKNFTKDNEHFVRRAAVVGLEGLQKFVLEAVSRFTKREFYVCDSVEEAMERLTKAS